jgi:hypothetical protein
MDPVHPEPADSKFERVLGRLSKEFDRVTQERHYEGAVKHGPVKFMTVDTLQEALDEVADLANYARYTYMKLRLLQEGIALQMADLAQQQQVPQGFIPSSETTKVKKDK